MADSQHTAEIKVQVDDAAGEAAIDRIIAKLKQAQQLGQGLGIGGGTPGAPGGGAPGGGAAGVDMASVLRDLVSTLKEKNAADAQSREERAKQREEAQRTQQQRREIADREKELQKKQQEAEKTNAYRTRQMGHVIGFVQGVAGSMGGASPSFAADLAQQGITATTSVITDAIQRSVEAAGDATGFLPGLGTLISGLGKLGAVGAGLVGRGMSMQYQDAVKLGGMDQTRATVEALGGDASLSSLRGAAGKGYAPEAALAMRQGFLHTAGFAGAGRALAGVDIYGAALSGVSPEGLARLAATGAPGGGTAGSMNLGGIVGVAERQFGLRGAKTDDFLSRIAAASEGMAEGGMSLDVSATVALASALASDSRAGQGTNPLRMALGVQGMAKGAAGQFGGMFSGLSDAALMSAAAKGARSPMEMMANLEALARDPQAARLAINSTFGGNADLAYLGGGMSSEFAGALASPLGGGDGGAGEAGGIRGTRATPLAARLANQQLGRLERVEMSGKADELIRRVHVLENILLKLGDKFDTWADGVAKLLDWVNRKL